MGVCLTVGVCLSVNVCLRRSLAMLREASGSPVPRRFLEPGSKSGCTTQSLMAELLCRGLLVRIKDWKPSPAGVFPDGLGRCQIADMGTLVHSQGAGGLCGLVFRGPGLERG